MPKCSLCGNDFAGNGILCPACYAKTPRTVRVTRPTVPVIEQIAAYVRYVPVTSALIALCLIIFVAMAISSKSLFFSIPTLVAWGGDAGVLLRQGDWWRVLVSMFLHGNPLHIVLDMWCLANLGPLAERSFGKTPFLLAYISTGICSGLASDFYHPTSVSVGASGAIFGIAGFLITPIALKRLTIYTTGKSSVLRTLIVFAVLNLAIGQSFAVIDNSAHVGGLVSGLLIGILFCTRSRTLGYAPDPPPSPPNTGDESLESRSTREIGR
jgi:membrane associated rhomboid family serine protease